MAIAPFRAAISLLGAVLCGLLAFCCTDASADITLERQVAVEGVGAMALGNMSGTSRTTISGNSSRTDNELKMQSKLVGFLARGSTGPSATIVRLDEDRIFHLNINKKEYTELTFEQMRQQMQDASDKLNGTSTGSPDQPAAFDESKCEWLPPKVDVKKGEKAQFAGYDAERMTVTAIQPCKDKESGAICDVALSLDEWLAAGFTENAELQRFYKAYAAKMGFDASNSQEMVQRAQALFSRYKGIWSEIATHMQGAKGYPMKISFTLGLGGEQCQKAGGGQAPSSDAGSTASAAPDSGSSSSSTSSGNNMTPSALAGAVAGKLGGLFHKKKDDSAAADSQTSGAPANAPAAPTAPATTPAALPPGEFPLMTITSTLVSVSTASASADAFVVPADYKKRPLKTD